jgi:hypothetical protein
MIALRSDYTFDSCVAGRSVETAAAMFAAAMTSVASAFVLGLRSVKSGIGPRPEVREVGVTCSTSVGTAFREFVEEALLDRPLRLSIAERI